MSFFRECDILIAGLICAIVLLIIGIVCFIITGLWYIIPLFLGGILLEGSFFLLSPKWFFSKIEITDIGINVIYRKTIQEVWIWNDILKIERTLNNNIHNLTLYNKENKTLIFNITRNRLKKITEFCPDTRVKELLKDVKFPIDYLKKEKK